LVQTVSLVVPAMLLSLAAVAAPARALPPFAAVAVFAGGALVGLLSERGRLALGLLVLLLAERALTYFGGRTIFEVVALLLPVNLGAIAWLGEASLFTVRGAWWLGAAVFQAGVVAILAALSGSLDQPIMRTDLGVVTALPQLAFVIFLGVLALVLARYARDGRPLTLGAAWALVASFLALDGAGTGASGSVHFVAAALLLVAGGVREPRPVVQMDGATRLPSKVDFHRALLELPRRYAIARVEIDEFARFRDQYGPDAVRRMLRRVADALRMVGGRGRVYYHGGPAFAVIFRRRSAETATVHLEAVRQAVELITLDVDVADPPREGWPGPPEVFEATVVVTISAGVAHAEGRRANPHDVVRAADEALDRARQAGMNRVVALARVGAKRRRTEIVIQPVEG
jgi:diguanylate cyclase (GGDEF)-like protein